MANTEKIVVQVVVQGDKQLDNLQKKAGTTTKSFAKMAGGILAAAAAFRQVNQVISNAVKSFRDFEFQMAKVKAITGAGRKEFLALSKSAQDLGRSTFFTAQQVAELQTNYGKLGFTTKEILAAQEATLNLATATDSDLARAAIVAGSAVRGFGLDASETQRVTDVMAKAFTSSALDLEKFQTSMTKVAPIAKSAGFSIEDTTAIMAQLADSGIEASIAGTSLRNILLKMQDPNSDLVQSFGKTIHSLDELVPAMAKFSSEGGSLAEIMEVVDLRQAAAFEQMITSRDRTVQLRDALKDANGAAAEMAHIVGDTLEGALKRSESAFQGLQIAFVEKFGEGMKTVTDGFANFINSITDFIETPISEKVNEDRMAMNNLFNAIQDVNTTQEQRTRLITRLNTKYGDYLPKLIDENDSLKDIKKSQVEANAALMQRVNILAAEERLVEIGKKQFENKMEADDLLIEKQDALEEQTKALAGTNERLAVSLSGVDVNVTNASTALADNAAKMKRNKEAAAELDKELEQASRVAKGLGVDVNALANEVTLETAALNGGGGGGGNTKATEDNTKAKLDNSVSIKMQKEDYSDYMTIMQQVLDGTINMTQAEELLRQERVKSIETAIAELERREFADLETAEQEIANHNLKMQLEKELIDLKVEGQQTDLALKQEAIDKTAALGSQLIQLAGQDKKMQGIRKAGVAISAAAAVANNILALSNMNLGVAAQAALPFPSNIIAMAGTLTTIISMIANLKALKDSFGDGGVVEAFASGGMVQGKSHAQGGEKFAVGGRVVELEGGEAVINKRSTSMFRSQLSAMNSAGGGVKFADGGMLNQPSFSQQQFNALGQNQMMSAMGGQQKVVVVEADITDSQNSVSVIESQATV